MKLSSLRDTIKKQETPFTRILYRNLKNLQNTNVKVPMAMAGILYNERNARHQLWQWFSNKFYYEPMMRYRCTSVGRNIRTDGDLPLIIGSGTIKLGDHVKIGNRCAFFMTANLFDTPELIIGNNTVINYMSSISVEQRVKIGNHCMLAGETKIFDNNSHGLDYTDGRKMTRKDVAPVTIEDYVWIGMRSIILKGVTIGKGSVVAACSVVTADVPSMTVVGGNPAVTIKKIDPNTPSDF